MKNSLTKTILFTFVCFLFGNNASSQKSSPVFYSEPTPWADSLIQTMNIDQMIGQLFMVASWSDPKHQNYDVGGMDLLISKYHIGGIIFFQGSPVRQAKLTNRFQEESSIPLMIGMDAEWGLGMRLDSTISYPRQMAMGAIQDEALIYDFGSEMARQLRRMGVQVSFSPVVDINNNPKNPVISNRAFGEDRELVTRFGLQYMNGLQEGGILANAKHFPGHGDTDSDSHKDLPIIPYDFKRLDSLELYPYKTLFKEGLASVMIAHLYVPALDSTPNLPSTLSKKIVQELLREKMGFNGLIFTDALNMQGVAKYFKSGELEVKALQAGNDVLLYSQSVPKAVEAIKLAIANGSLTEEDIRSRCLRILRAKEWAGLDHFKNIETKNLVGDLNNPDAQALQRRIVESSITVLRNEGDIAPLCHSDTTRIAVISIGTGACNPFSKSMARYAKFDVFSMDKNPDLKTSMAIHDTLITYDLVVGAMLNTSNKASKNFGVSNEAARILNSVGAETEVVLSVFANPYSFAALRDMDNIKDLILAYQDDSLTQQIVAEVIAGACTADGKLPVSASSKYVLGEGVVLDQQTRLRWVTPAYLHLCGSSTYSHEYGLNSAKQDPKALGQGMPYKEDMMSDRIGKAIAVEDNCFVSIDSIAQSGIKKGAYPGCRVLLAKDGFVVYDKAFGYLDWDKKDKVTTSTVYDLASITKLASGTLAAMKLADQGLLDINKKLGDYLDLPKGNAYAEVPLKNMLSHTAGFTPWIPFYQKTMSNGRLDSAIYKTKEEAGYTFQLAKDIFILDSYRDTMFNEILSTPLSSDKSYKYSDLTFYFIQRIVEKQTGRSLDEFVMNSFYAPMGLKSMGYNPLERMNVSVIAPTENDEFWRHQHVRGFVHDQGAAMMGGVGGHAGLFSDAQDLAAIMQMLLNGGTYGGQRYLSKEVINSFNTRYFPGNRRGLGFDKPAFSKGTGSACAEASESSFGHTGFTGTMCWADPSDGMVYIFLSNRVDPNAENKKIQEMDIRTKIQSEAYRLFGAGAQ